jgi:hypothetical protein
VRANNGHSWPEVFFPEYGWIQFEPTVIIAPINWPAPPPDPNAANSSNSGDRASSNPMIDREMPLMDGEDMERGASAFVPELDSSGPSPAFFGLVGLLVVAAAGAGVTYWVTEKRGTSGLSLVERAYTRMWRFAAWLGVPSPPDQTPYERADVLKTLVPEAQPPISRITDMYVVERFGRGNGNGDGAEAEDQWSLLRSRLWRAWFQKKISRFQREERNRWQDFYDSYQSGSRSGGEKRTGE